MYYLPYLYSETLQVSASTVLHWISDMCLSSGDRIAQVVFHCKDGLISNYYVTSVPVGQENETKGC